MGDGHAVRGSTFQNAARLVPHPWAGMPTSVSGQDGGPPVGGGGGGGASGLNWYDLSDGGQAGIISDGMSVTVSGGGLWNPFRLVPNDEHMNIHRAFDPWYQMSTARTSTWSMLETAEIRGRALQGFTRLAGRVRAAVAAAHGRCAGRRQVR